MRKLLKKAKKTIAIAFDLNLRHASEIFSGVSDYITESQIDWQLMPLNFGFEARLVELARSGKLTGAIGTFVSDQWVKGLLNLDVPAINMFNFSKIEVIPSVGPDEFATGKAAASHLRTQAVETFAFFRADGVHYTRLREAGFESGLEGVDYIKLCPGPSLPCQLKAIKSQTGTVGVFCSNDLAARELIIIARQQGVKCGKDLLVVGVGNDPSESIFAGIGISSFKQPIRETGYFAAQALHDWLRLGQQGTKQEILLPGQLIPRESSLASNRARTGQQAAQYIKEHLSDSNLDAASLARQVGVSRRSLELATNEQFKTSPYQMIAKIRFDAAVKLLCSTRVPVMEVGARCGYPEAHHFSAWFKNKCGFAPKTYRDNNMKLEPCANVEIHTLAN